MASTLMLEAGDVLIRSVDKQYVVLDAISHTRLDGPFFNFADALGAALVLIEPGRAIWQENTDIHGRLLDPPTRVV